MVESIEFYDEDTGAPIDNLSGAAARWLAEHSGLIQLVLEGNPAQQHLQIPVSMPSDRIQTFRKIIRGIPVGYTVYNGVEFYPLGPQEEKNIENAFQAVKNNWFGNLEYYRRVARSQTMKEVLQYLMLDDEGKERMLLFDDHNVRYNNNNNEKELKRRENHTRKFRAKRNRNQWKFANMSENEIEKYMEARGASLNDYMNENAIETRLEGHRYDLYTKYRNRNPEKLATLLSKNTIAKLNKQRNATRKNIMKQQEELRKDIEELQKIKNRTKNDEEWDYYDNKQRDLYGYLDAFNNDSYNEYGPNYYNNRKTNNMSNVAYEKYLRSLRRPGVEKYLPYQGPLIGNFFGNQNNI